MKYRVYTNKNISTSPAFIFATYFKTKREAVAHAEMLKNDSTVTEIHLERKVATSWVSC